MWQKNGFTVQILYSSAAVATQILLSSGESSVLVDAGDGVLRDLLSIGSEPELLDAIILTHGHYDHVGGLHSLLGYIKMRKRRDMLPVFLPRGCEQPLGLLSNFQAVSPGEIPFILDSRELDDGDSFRVGPFNVSAAYVTHCSKEPDGSIVAMPAAGYRICDGKMTVAITGDCGDSESVRGLVRDADLALIEASFEFYSSEFQKKVHLTTGLAEEIGSLAREHVLIHRQA